MPNAGLGYQRKLTVIPEGSRSLNLRYTVLLCAMLFGAILTAVVIYDVTPIYGADIDNATVVTENLAVVLEEHARQAKTELVASG